jgi:hypothetical protein
MENGLSSNEKILESNITELENKSIKEKIYLQYEKKSSDYYIFLNFPSKTNSKDCIKLLLLINTIKNRIYLYPLNIIQISDGRDLLPFITKKLYNKINYNSLNLIKLVEEINIYVLSLTEKSLSKIGRFYLGEEYDIKIIHNLKNIYTLNCFHCDLINGNYFDIPSLVTISDDYFCLYEYADNNKYNKEINNNKLTLVFYGTIKSILSFKKSLVGSIVTITFRKDLKGQVYSLKIMSDIDEDMENIMDILIKKIENIGFRMNIYQKRKGSIPDINIENTEENIKAYEDIIKAEEENSKVIKELLGLYEKAIEYYSAINDKRYIDYNNKIKRLLKNEKYSKLIA